MASIRPHKRETRRGLNKNDSHSQVAKPIPSKESPSLLPRDTHLLKRYVRLVGETRLAY